jgi:hypothetical protein
LSPFYFYSILFFYHIGINLDTGQANKKLPIMKTIFNYLIAAVCITTFFPGCSKNDSNSSGNARMQVFLSDDPGAFDAVYIDVQDVRINLSSDTANGWQSLSGVHAGSYNLLTLVNDQDTMLADSDIPASRIEQIRLVLGPNNYVVVNGQQIPLETPSAQQSGLKLNIHQDVSAGVLYQLMMDFDVAHSIVQTGNNHYILKPTIRTSLIAAGGSIKGVVNPFNFQTGVAVFRGPNDTVTTTFNSALNGGYLVRGLAPGTYSLYFKPTNNTYRDSVVTGISVTNGNVTAVDTLRLHQ